MHSFSAFPRHVKACSQVKSVQLRRKLELTRGKKEFFPTKTHEELIRSKKYDEIPPANRETQTDPQVKLLEKAPIFIPAKTGIDETSQILEGDLFDFDREVDPLLSVILARTLQQSLNEVWEETEAELKKKKRQDYLEKRERELDEVERLEAEQERREKERQRRVLEADLVTRLEVIEMRKSEARRSSETYLLSLIPRSLRDLRLDEVDLKEIAIEISVEDCLKDY